jgi:Tfp pilus assembly protein PilO
MKKSRAPQLFLILAAVALAAGAGGTFLQYQELSEKWDKVAELKKTSRDPKEIQAELDKTGEELSKSKTELEHLEKSVPAFAYIPTMLRELEQFGKLNAIEVLGVRPIPKQDSKDKKKKKQAYEEIAIEVKGRGDFKSVQQFVTALQKFPKIVGVRSVSLQPKNDPNEIAGKKLDVTIELRAYLFAPGAEEKVALPEGAKPADPKAAGASAPANPSAHKPQSPAKSIPIGGQES